MSKNNLIFIGTIKKEANCGESMKNHIMLNRFREVFSRVLAFDTWGVKHQPWRFIELFIYLLFYPKAKIVVSASTYIAYDVIRFLSFIGRKNIYYWVIGGVFPSMAKKYHYKISYYRKLNGIFVESNRMVRELEEMDVYNAQYVPNFKHINYQPIIKNRDYDKIKFVFLSRVHPDKGCPLIIESVKYLNHLGYQDKFSVDFYGPIDPMYVGFEDAIKNLENVKYKGFLKLDNNGYDTLSQYNMMLFPTFWDGEGFPGIMIDAFTAGLPVLASNWSFNSELIDDGITGMIIPYNNQEALNQAMKKVVDGEIDLKVMSDNSYGKAKEYDDRNVLSIDKLKTLTVIE